MVSEEELNEFIVNGGAFFANVSEDKTYKENFDLVYKSIENNHNLLVSALSFKTFCYLKHSLANDFKKEIDRASLLGEDFDILLDIGILELESMKINERYRNLLEVILEETDKKETIYNTTIKAVVDVYGYLTFPDLIRLMNRKYNQAHKWTKKELKERLSSSILIKSTTNFNNDEVYRKELEDKKSDLIKLRNKVPGLYYQSYDINDLVNFCGTFSFDGKSQFAKKDLLGKMFITEIDLCMYPEVYSNLPPIYEKYKDKIMEIELKMPKWFLKGFTLKLFSSDED